MTNIFYYETSIIDWCENNYTVNNYVCEFLNSITGLYFLYIFYLNNLNYKYIQNSDKLNYFKLLNWMIFFLSIFTFIFHCTLSFFGQLSDEYMIFLLFMIFNVTNINLNLIIKILLGIFMPYLLGNYNRYLLLGLGVYKFNNLIKIYKYNENNNKIFKILILNLFFGLLCWYIDIFYCDNLYISLHFIWHLLSANALYYMNLLYMLNMFDNLKIKKSKYYYILTE